MLTEQEKKEIKEYLEANLLNGDKIQDGQMIASVEIIDVVFELAGEMKSKWQREVRDIAYNFDPHTNYKGQDVYDAIDDFIDQLNNKE